MWKKIAASWLLGGLAACGGGGDADEPPIAVTITPSNATATGVAGQFAWSAALQLSAVLSSAPTGPVYVVIQSSSSAIQTGAVFATVTGTNTYSATIAGNQTLAAGTYSGSLTLRLCKDTQCASEYPLTGASVPFTITMINRPKITLTTTAADGTTSTVAVATGGNDSFNVPKGRSFTLNSDTPVTWTEQDLLVSMSGVTKTSTSYTGVPTLQPGSGNAVQFRISPIAVPDYPMMFYLDPQ